MDSQKEYPAHPPPTTTIRFFLSSSVLENDSSRPVAMLSFRVVTLVDLPIRAVFLLQVFMPSTNAVLFNNNTPGDKVVNPLANKFCANEVISITLKFFMFVLFLHCTY